VGHCIKGVSWYR